MFNPIASGESQLGSVSDLTQLEFGSGSSSDPLQAAFAALLAELTSNNFTPPPAPDSLKPALPPKSESTDSHANQPLKIDLHGMAQLPWTPLWLPNSQQLVQVTEPVRPSFLKQPIVSETASLSVNGIAQSSPDKLPGNENGEPQSASVRVQTPPDAPLNSIQIQVESLPASIGLNITSPPLPFVEQLKTIISEATPPTDKLPSGDRSSTVDPTPLAVANVTGRPQPEPTGPTVPPRQEEPAVIVVSDVLKPPITFSQKQNAGDSPDERPKQSADSTGKAVGPVVHETGTDAPPAFERQLVAATSTTPAVPVQEMQQTPLQGTAHKVSIDIGEKDSKVIVTLHERAGDVSVKVHAANNVLKNELQSSVGTLVESLQRAQVSLKNLDFTSGYGNAADTGRERNSSHPNTPQTRSRRRSQPKEEVTDSVDLRLLKYLS